MKKTIVSVFLLLFISFVFASCAQKHEHVFNKKVIDERYIASQGNEDTPTKYYYSCECGEKGQDTFEYTLNKDKKDEQGHTHVFDIENTDVKYLAEAATVDNPAKYYYSCECGEKGENTFSFGTPLDKNHVHDFNCQQISGYYLAKKGNCTTQSEYYYSCACGEKGSNTFTYGNIGEHDLLLNSGKKPTCTEDGYEQYYTCKNCDYSTYKVIPKVGHKAAEKVRIENEIPADFTKCGSYDEVTYCTYCNMELGRKKVNTDVLTEVNITYKVDHINHGYIDGVANQKLISSNQKTSKVTAKAKIGYKFVKWSDGKTNAERNDDYKIKSGDVVALSEIDSLNLPTLKVNLNSGEFADITKEDYSNCVVSIGNTTDKFTLENVTAKIKGHGNGNWLSEKKSYKIKFDSKENVFGFGKNKDWILLPNYYDTTLIRNYLVFETARVLPTQANSPKSAFVEVFFNEEYCGVYQIIQKIEDSKDRIDLGIDLDDFNESNLSYIVELDARVPYAEDGSRPGWDWFMDSKTQYSYMIKEPDTGDKKYTFPYAKMIATDFNNTYNTLISGTWQQIEAKIDVDSFAENYIIYELFADCDLNYSSFYLYKCNGGKLICGPLWDFDSCAGNSTYQNAHIRTSYYARRYNPWFKLLFKHNKFVEIVKKKYTQYRNPLEKEINKIISQYQNPSPSFSRNFERYDYIGKKLYREPAELVAVKTYSGVVGYLKDWLNDRFSFLDSEYLN